MSRGDPNNIRGRVDLYFDHNGKAYLEYEDSLSPTYVKMRDLTCTSDEVLEVRGIETGEPFKILKRSMLDVKSVIPFVLEFGKTGKIDVSGDLWEHVSEGISLLRSDEEILEKTTDESKTQVKTKRAKKRS